MVIREKEKLNMIYPLNKEKPPHSPPSFHSKTANHQTHRCFYIDGRCEFAFFADTEKDIKIVLDKFLRNKDFLSLKEYSSPEWDHIGLLDYFPETNEVFLTTDKKTKNIILREVSSATISKEAKAKLQEERRIKEEEDQRLWEQKEAERKLKKEEKQRKHSEKMLRKAAKEAKLAKKRDLELADLEEGVSVAAGSEKAFDEKIQQKKVSKGGTRSLI